MTQHETVLEHLMKYQSISSMEAFEEYKITRVGAIIYNLRHKDNLYITTEPIKYVGSSGKLKTGWIYRLVTPAIKGK